MRAREVTTCRSMYLTHTGGWDLTRSFWNGDGRAPSIRTCTAAHAHVVILAAVGEPAVEPPVSSVHLSPVAGSVVSPLRNTMRMPAEKASGSAVWKRYAESCVVGVLERCVRPDVGPWKGPALTVGAWVGGWEGVEVDETRTAPRITCSLSRSAH